jgi:gliding motility-associated-like protein
VAITEPGVLTSTVANTNILCHTQCSGTATITASGGTLPYSFSYNNIAPTNNAVAINLCSGPYVGTVTDGNGCISQQSFTVTQPLPIAITTTVSNPLCNAACNGSITTEVTGGTPGYSYSWITAGGNSQNPTGLCAGSYTLTVTDNNSCTSQTVVALTNPSLLLANLTSTNPICGTNCTGSLRANPNGGSPAHTYSCSNVSSAQTINLLSAGTYSVIVTDINNCSVTQSVSLISPALVAINPAITPAACGSSNGSINAVAIGGNAPFSYSWSPPIPIAQVSNTVVSGIPAGIYTVVVSDVSACTATAVIALSNSNGPTGATITTSNVACNGDCNGSAIVSNPTGGTAPYFLSWASPAVASATVGNLCVGGYTAQITDDNNCILFQSATISEPQSIDDNEILSSANCAGNCNGQIALNPSGGNGGFTYLWSNGQNTSSIGSLCPGIYSVTIIDNQNCTFTTNYNLPSLVTITSGTMATNNVCYDDCSGTLLAAGVAGGLPPYTFTWSDPLGQTTPTAVGLCNGNYSVTITDANGCFNAIPADITSPSKVLISSNVIQPSCNSCDGAVSVTPSGGTPTYSLVWSNGQSGTSISNLCAGVFDVLITDGNGCAADTSVIINSITGFTNETIVKTDVTCSNQCDGSVTVTAVGGTAPVSYFWLHDNSTSQSLTGLCQGVYFCNMTDVNGCVRTASVVINSVTTISLTSQVFQTSCASNTGSISAIANGGTGTISYNWLPAGTGTGTLVTNLVTGIYTVTATDANGCLVSEEFSLGSINGPVITASVNNLSCSGSCDGSVQISINGGSPGYTILWSNSVNTSSITNVCEGSYSVSVTDALGCVAVENFSVSGTPLILFSTPNINEPLCFADCNGSITALPIGGTLPYTFSWTPSSSSLTSNDQLCAGNYTFNVTDANGCLTSQSYTLISPSVITLTANVTDASCSTVTDGSIDISITGGSPAYTYTWSNTETTEDITNLLPGNYSVTIVDLNGCSKDSSFIINPAIIVDAVAGNDTVLCQGGSLILNASNSTGGNVFQWIELPSGSVISNTTITTISPSPGTTTFVLVTQNGLCTDRDTIYITSNPLPNVDAGPVITMPIFTSTIIGGNPTAASGTSITWVPSLGLDDINASNPVSSTTITTTYTVTIVDANGCINSDTVTVYVLPEIRIPNGFSPNGDGKNDTWILDLIYLFPYCEIEVYNRWGEQLFYSKGYNTPFNGQYKGKDLPVGTYYYIVNLNDPKYPKPYTGPLTIFR